MKWKKFPNRPRNDQETCNFSIEALFLPPGASGKAKQKTSIYKEKNYHLFDVGDSLSDDGNNESEQHYFSFPLTKEEQTNSSMKRFIEFRVFDHSNSFCRSQKYLLGHVLHPVDAFPEFATMEEFGAKNNISEGIFKNYNISDIVDGDADSRNNELFVYWNELKCRKDDTACNFVQKQEKMEILSTE